MAVKRESRKAPSKQQNGSQQRRQIAQIAYELYVRRGRLDGCDLQDWLQAEQIVNQRRPQA